MPYLTLTEYLKLQLSPGLVASYNIQPGNGVGLFWDKHIHVYLLTHLPQTHTGLTTCECVLYIRVVTSHHVTKTTVTPFDPPQWKTPCHTQTSWLCFIERKF